MGNSLADQLLKSGLVNKKQVKKAGKAKKHQKHMQQAGKVTADNSIEEKIQQEALAKREKDRALDAERKAKLSERELAAQVLQLLQHHQIEGKGEAVYNYTLDGKVKQWLVSDTQRHQLVKGYVALAHMAGTTYMVPGAVAERIQSRQPDVIILWNKNESSESNQVDKDDPYADYEIPDDLMW